MFSSELTIQNQRKLNTPQFSSLPANNLLCNSQTGTISISPVDYAETYTWTVTGGYIKFGNDYSTGVSEIITTSTSVNIAANSQGQGNSYITVRANTTGIVSSDQQLVGIWTGSPVQPTIDGLDVITEAMLYGNIYYLIANPQNQSSIHWTATGGLQTVGDVSDWRCQVIPTYNGNTAVVSVTVTNNCGTKNTSKAVWVDLLLPDPEIYPNPASTEFTIDFSKIEPENQLLTQQYNFYVQDQDGAIYLRGQSKEKIKVFSLKRVPEGVFFVVIQYNNKVSTKSLVVKKR